MSSGIRRQKKRWAQPLRLFDKERIDDENVFMEKYGLKNKKEIWKIEFSIKKIRNQAKGFITADPKDKDAFIERLAKKGLIKANAEIDDVLAMTRENLVGRRLQTLVFKKRLSHTAKEARQMITHRKVMVGDRIVNIPSYSVAVAEEKMIKIVPSKPKAKKESVMEEVKTREIKNE
ncbi:MAG: 30S ribosomal protein S4 [Nanoarchaeota archaeon]|nr:30S ribosomal protein S4 [Nanoarchaeota archaeon]